MTEEEQNKMEKDILFQIDMQLYDEFNDTIATMYDHLGDIYSLRDVEEVEKAEKEKEIKLLREAIKKLQADIEKRISFEVIKELKNKIDDKISEVETNRSYGRYKQYGGKIKLDSYLAQLYGHKKAFEMLLEMEKRKMTQRINDKLKKCCELCQSNLDKPCAWLSLGNEYCDTIMEVQSDIEIKDKVIDELINFLLNYDIDEDYCKKIERQECNKYKEGYCDKCIKQHFYKEEENNETN